MAIPVTPIHPRQIRHQTRMAITHLLFRYHPSTAPSMRISSRALALSDLHPTRLNNAYLALNYNKQLVPNFEVLLPTSTCASCNPSTVASSSTWSPRAMADLVERLGGAIVSPHSQSVPQVLHTVRVLKERGSLNWLKGIIIPEGVDQLREHRNYTTGLRSHTVPAHKRRLPTRRSHGSVTVTIVAQLNASPTRSVGPATYVDLDDPALGGRFLGTTHMMMVGTNV